MNQAIAERFNSSVSALHVGPKLDALIKPSPMAWPTLILLLIVAVGWLLTGYMGVNGMLPLALAIVLNSVLAYLSFTVMHDASHRAVSKRAWVNEVAGNIAVLPLIPLPLFRVFRFAHMQHHRFTNEEYDKDPDTWTSTGSPWMFVLRWATIDVYYLYFYFKNLDKRPKGESTIVFWGVAISVIAIGGVVVMGYGAQLFLLWFLPGRIAIIFLAFAFDYLPHIPKKATQKENPYQATNNRIGLEFVMTPIFVYQNYHLIHHLYPRVPFYRYTRIWRHGQDEFKKRGALSLNWKGEEV